ncbi:ATP-dependent nuclease [Pseudonocardia sp. D17]|uniref:ATP-dependent nuclease n=1 Tax=Pseudonocardia sp. D17 TaxID=882661 RepID=UPI002B3DFFDD|nr:ATP-dependent endonuclease [Pseudonocardia sp. D17]
MQISKVRIRNFRNLANVEFAIGQSAIFVGENRSGKSNLIHALRLVLDPSLSYRDLQLRREDFWDGLSDGTDAWDPLDARQEISVSVDISGFQHDPIMVTSLADCLVEEDPPLARITYRFAPVEQIDDDGNIVTGARPVYEGQIFGGDSDEVTILRALRRYLHLEYLGALRDVESDIRNWRDSPLRQLLEAAASAVPDEDLAAVGEAMKTANDELNALQQIKDLGEEISERLEDMVGPAQALTTELAVAPDDPLRLIRNMRIFVDGDAKRVLSSASLGALNVLYLALLELGLSVKLTDAEYAHVLLAIEEPEAHLHPHLQRLIFARLLENLKERRTVIVTTQSPHIASVADPRALVVLRNEGGETRAASAVSAQLSEDEWDDVRRYLDATRAELVFAKKVLLVEGFAEQVMMPTLAASLGLNLDKLGISVCAIHGTHFESYVKFCDALELPWVVVTDGDTIDQKTGLSEGDKRAAAILDCIGRSGNPAENGAFVGGVTFEYDLIADIEENVAVCYEALRGLCAKPSQAKIDSWGTAATGSDDFLKMIKNAGGKGRYAQRLSVSAVKPPHHVQRALEYLAGK